MKFEDIRYMCPWWDGYYASTYEEDDERVCHATGRNCYEHDCAVWHFVTASTLMKED